MRTSITRTACAVAIAACATLASSDDACGQVTVTTVQTSAPAVIGYVPERRGLFGLRTAYRPIVGAVPVQKTVTVQQAPVAVQRPPVYVPTPVTVQRPPVYVPTPAPVYAPAPVYVPAPVVPVTTYLAPVTPVPVTTYYTPLYPRY